MEENGPKNMTRPLPVELRRRRKEQCCSPRRQQVAPLVSSSVACLLHLLDVIKVSAVVVALEPRTRPPLLLPSRLLLALLQLSLPRLLPPPATWHRLLLSCLPAIL